MRICFLFSEPFSSFPPQNTAADLYILPFAALGEVDFDDEISGRSKKLKALAALSKKFSAAIVCGCYTSIKGIKRKSAAVADKGRIIGIADEVNIIGGGDYRPGTGLKIFDFPSGKIGIAVAEDVLFPDVIKSLADCGCSAIVCPFEKLSSFVPVTVARANAYVYGTEIALCADNYSLAAAPSGEVAFASAKSGRTYEFFPEAGYRETTKKERGFYGF